MTSMSTVTSVPAKTPVRRLPAEEGVWVFIFADIMLFTAFFNVFVYYRARAPQLFSAGQATLDWHFGLSNTVLLLTSSWFVACAMGAVRRHRRRAAYAWFGAALACGLGFGVLKVIEYAHKIVAGITLTTNDFYMYYFMFTGLHLVHLLLGMAVLLYLLVRLQKPAWSESDVRACEGGAAYWHLVDLLWIVLFPLIYLLR